MTQDVTPSLTGNDLPAFIHLFGGEVPGGCLKGFLQPDVDGFLKWKKVCVKEKPGIMFSEGNNWLQKFKQGF